ncbi:MAG: insulinase family protein [Saprospiraceae bacterium]|nr:insulinase family protein [Saprospiraceae bacterium]MCB0623065.1 insulinase family protein [Saprospiraceae bacterium]MCB0681310.1 insulinase family protein [Saprospiraceae bacterium]
MKRILFLGLTALLALTMCTPKTVQKAQQSTDQSFRKQPPAPLPAPKIEIGSHEQFQLGNGLKVIVVENHKLPQVSFQVFVDAPDVHEGEAAGFIDMAGTMLSRGTANRSKGQIDEAIDFMGASLSTSASGLFGTALTKHVDGLLDIMSDVLLHPSFPQEEFDKLKTQTLSGLAASKDDPNTIAENVGRVLRYGKDHPYGNVQTEESTGNATVELCQTYYQTYFKPNISYLVVVGDITADKAKMLAEKYFGSWKKGDVPQVQQPKPGKPDEAKVAFVDKAGAVQSVINITYPIDLKPGAPDVVKASVLNTLLGGYFRSRLNNNLREDKGYTYGARSTISSDRLVGEFRAYASVRNEVTDSSMVEFLKELNRVRTEKVAAEELNLVKNYVSGNFALALESPQTIARFALNTVRYNLPDDYYSTYLEKVASVTADDILAMAQKYVHPAKAYLLVVGNKKAVADKLVQFDANGEIDNYDYFGNPVSDLALPEGLTAQNVISDYLNAIGGKEKLMQVKTLKTVMSAESPMGNLAITTYLQAPNSVCNEVAVNGNIMQKQVFDGKQGQTVAMGQKMPMTPEEVAEMKENAQFFKEMAYLGDDYQIELSGIEMINGQKAYRIDVVSPSGSESTEYYAMETSFKVRESSTQEGGGQTVTVTQDYADYKEVDGVKIPHQMTISGMMPVPMTFDLQEAKVNAEISADVFKVQ